MFQRQSCVYVRPTWFQARNRKTTFFCVSLKNLSPNERIINFFFFQFNVIQWIRRHTRCRMGDFWWSSLHQRSRGKQSLLLVLTFTNGEVYSYITDLVLVHTSLLYCIVSIFNREEWYGKRYLSCYQNTSVLSCSQPRYQILWNSPTGLGKNLVIRRYKRYWGRAWIICPSDEQISISISPSCESLMLW